MKLKYQTNKHRQTGKHRRKKITWLLRMSTKNIQEKIKGKIMLFWWVKLLHLSFISLEMFKLERSRVYKVFRDPLIWLRSN